MAHDPEIQEKLDRLETPLTQLEAGELSISEAARLHEEGHRLLDECRTLITPGEGEIIERKTQWIAETAESTRRVVVPKHRSQILLEHTLAVVSGTTRRTRTDRT